MLIDPKLRAQVAAIKDKFWTGNATSTSSYEPYESSLDMFGADAVEQWFTEKEVKEVVEFANQLAVGKK
jgi:hypothetical protein